MAKLERDLQSPVKGKPNKVILDRGPWWEQNIYKNYPLHADRWEDDGGVTQETKYVRCKRYERLIPLELCMKGIFYFDPKNRDCKNCWKLPKGVDYPRVFKNTPKENKMPEALMVLSEAKQKQTKIKPEEGGTDEW